MASNDDGPPLSLRPFPVADKEPKNLADFIARVNAQPGGFRALTETALRDDVRAGDDVSSSAVELDQVDVDMADGPDADDDASQDPAAARIEVLKNVDIAGNTAMLTLDSLSLLLSKQNPTTASLTLSQQLRDMVGIGTLGAEKLDEPNTNEAKTKALADVATGWTLLEINKTRDAADAASSLLEKEVEIENRYWQDVMAVKKAGWSTCRVPHERHTLGVRFGFSEASAEFKNNGLAPMRRGEDGSVELDLGRLGGVSEGLVVTYQKHGQVVGRSVPRRRSGGDPSLEARVLEARNTIFSQELWHELTREARTLAAYDVRLEGSRLTYKMDAASALTMELLPLASCPSPDDDAALPDDGTAEAVSASLHILLSHAHRHSELMRTRPMPPHVPRSRGQQTHALLRPIIARMTSRLSVAACTRRVAGFVHALRAAGFASSFTLRTPPVVPAPEPDAAAASAAPGASNQSHAAQALVRNMLQPLDFIIEFDMLPGASLTIRGRTILFPVTTTFYHVFLAPASSLLHGLGAPYPDGYPDLGSLSDYLDTTIARALTRHFLAGLAASKRWTQSVLGTSIRDAESETLDMHFSLHHRAPAAAPAIVLTSTVTVHRVPQQRKWQWLSPESRRHDDDEDPVASEPRPLAEVVAEVVAKSSS